MFDYTINGNTITIYKNINNYSIEDVYLVKSFIIKLKTKR